MKSKPKFKPMVVYNFHNDMIGIWVGPLVFDMGEDVFHYWPFDIEYGSGGLCIQEEMFNQYFRLIGYL